MPPVIQPMGAPHPIRETIPSTAPDGATEVAGPVEPPSRSEKDLLATRDLIGSIVLGADGRQIGKVSDILVDSEGRLSGYMLTFGGYMGAGCCTAAMSAARAELSRTGQDRGIVVFTDLSPDDLQNLKH